MAAYACQTRTVQSGSADRSETSCRSLGNYWQSQAVCGSEEDRCGRFDPCNELDLLIGGDAGGSPDVAPAPAGVPSSGWWDRLAAVAEGAWGVAGDALNLRGDEALLDAQEELAAFRASTFAPLIDHQPSSGYGMFDLRFDPASGQLLITLKVAYEFVDGDPAVSSPGIPAAELRWTPEEQEAWKARYRTEVSAQWSGQHGLRSTRPGWDSMVVHCGVRVVEDPADPHFTLRVGRYPSDVAMAPSAVDVGDREATLDNNDLRPEPKLDWDNPVTEIPFKRGSAALDGVGRVAVRSVAEDLAAAPASRVELRGRSSTVHRHGIDAARGVEENLELARARSAAVRAAVVSEGIAAARVSERNAGELDAGPGDSWCRVDARIGERPAQSPALHETGHMFGLRDEYPSRESPAGSPVATDYGSMIRSTTGVEVRYDSNEGVMSEGSVIQPWHYSSFLEALRKISGVQEWAI